MKTPRESPVMPVASGWEFSDRWKQFLLSLLNATLLLGIVFVILGLILLSKIETFTENVLDDVRLGLLQEVNADVKSTISAIGTTERDLKLIASRLDAIVKHPEITLSPTLLKGVRSVSDELQKLQKSTAALPGEVANQLMQRFDAAVGHSVVTIAPPVQQAITALSHDVRTVQKTLAKLTSSHASVSDHAIRSVASAVADAIINVRQCRVELAAQREFGPAQQDR